MAIETIGEAWRAGWRVRAKCAAGKRDGMKSVRPCTKTYDLDLETLVWTRGEAMPLSQLGERLKCPTCGSRRVVVMFSPPAPPGRAREEGRGSARANFDEDPNNAYVVVPCTSGPHGPPASWWSVLRNGEPAWLCSTREAADRYATDPAYRASLVTKMAHEQ